MSDNTGMSYEEFLEETEQVDNATSRSMYDLFAEMMATEKKLQSRWANEEGHYLAKSEEPSLRLTGQAIVAIGVEELQKAIQLSTGEFSVWAIAALSPPH